VLQKKAMAIKAMDFIENGWWNWEKTSSVRKVWCCCFDKDNWL